MNASDTVAATMLDAALAYAAKGFPVFPCQEGNKRPYTRNGFKEATTDPEQIRIWWSKWPNAMIGMPTGAASGYWVLDIDDPDEFECGCWIDIPQTRRVDTGKGYHLYFVHVEGIRNKQRGSKGAWPIPEIPGAEVRGEGGYVILPPSRHPSGQLYRLADGREPAHAPTELLALVRRGKVEPTPSPVKIAGSAIATTSPGSATEDHPYAIAALKSECDAIRTAPFGAQERTLNAAALKVGHYVGGGALALQTARDRLLNAASSMRSHRSGDPWTAELLEAKIDRALRDGMAQPKKVPERKTIAPQPHHSSDRGEAVGDIGLASAPPAPEWDEPVDLWASYVAPELPHGLLPSAIEVFARSHGDTMGVDPAGLAMACLTVCAAAITDEIQLQVKQHDPSWRESARLWVGLVGAPSMKKSPILSAAARPLKRSDGNLMRAYMEKRQAYDALPAKERKEAERPRQERRIIADTTVEAGQEVLRDSPRGVLSLQDELSGWFGQMDKYAPGKGSQADRGFWLQAYNGGSYSLNRISRGVSYITNCSISLLGGIQPEPIRALAGDTNDDGLIQRLIPVILRPGKVGRDVPSDGTLRDYEALIERLELLRAEGGPLMFDQSARTIRERLEAEHLELSSSLEGVSPKMAAHFGKYDGLFARLCVLWHCIEEGRGGLVPKTISGETAERVEQFMRQFIRPSAVAFYAGLLGMSAGHDQLRDVAAWIVSAHIQELRPRDVQRAGQRFKHVTADEVRLICEKLEAFGWGCWGEPSQNSNRKPFLINPRVHVLFAERGKAEAERRAKARDVIRKTVGR